MGDSYWNRGIIRSALDAFTGNGKVNKRSRRKSCRMRIRSYCARWRISLGVGISGEWGSRAQWDAYNAALAKWEGRSGTVIWPVNGYGHIRLKAF